MFGQPDNAIASDVQRFLQFWSDPLSVMSMYMKTCLLEMVGFLSDVYIELASRTKTALCSTYSTNVLTAATTMTSCECQIGKHKK